MRKKKQQVKSVPPLFWIVLTVAAVAVIGLFFGGSENLRGVPTAAACQDSDGDYPFTRGVVVDATGDHWDRCYDEGMVTEYVCGDDGKAKNIEIGCPGLCEKGACHRS